MSLILISVVMNWFCIGSLDLPQLMIPLILRETPYRIYNEHSILENIFKIEAEEISYKVQLKQCFIWPLVLRQLVLSVVFVKK